MSVPDAVAAVKVADGVWKKAMYASTNARPNDGFAQRVRDIGDAAEQMHNALLALIAVGGVQKAPGRPQRFPHEVSEKAHRPGDPELWSQWDAAVAAWEAAAAGTSFPEVARAVEPIAQLAHRLADSIEADRDADDQRASGSGR